MQNSDTLPASLSSLLYIAGEREREKRGGEGVEEFATPSEEERSKLCIWSSGLHDAMRCGDRNLPLSMVIVRDMEWRCWIHTKGSVESVDRSVEGEREFMTGLSMMDE